jgi:Flp pilus assembly protein TadB
MPSSSSRGSARTYLESGDLHGSVIAAMDTSGRAILLAGATVVIALLGMFATGVAFMYGLAIAAVIAVLLTMVASPARGARSARVEGQQLSGPLRYL